MASAREARRRQLLERGSDRLAFITGQARSLPPPSSPPTPQNPEAAAATTATAATYAPKCEDYAGHHELSKHSTGGEDVSSTINSRVDPSPETETRSQIPKLETSDEILECEKSNVISRNEPARNAHHRGTSSELPTSSMAQGSFDQASDSAPSTAPRKNHHMFIPSQISHSISGSENLRLICAVTVALLVVLSNKGYTLGGAVLGSLINFRPLFLVLLSDITIVLGLLMATPRSHEKDEGRTSTRQEERGLADIGKILELWMLFQKAFRALFMDCSICAVIMICGLNVLPQ